MHETQILGLIKELRTHLHDVPITAAAAAAVGPSSANGGEAGTGKGSKKGRSKRKKAQPAGTEPGDVEEREEEVGRQENHSAYCARLVFLKTASTCFMSSQPLDSTSSHNLYTLPSFSVSQLAAPLNFCHPQKGQL